MELVRVTLHVPSDCRYRVDGTIRDEVWFPMTEASPYWVRGNRVRDSRGVEWVVGDVERIGSPVAIGNFEMVLVP